MTDQQTEKPSATEATAAELRVALQHALDSEQEGYTDDNEPSWMTEARAVLTKGRTTHA